MNVYEMWQTNTHSHTNTNTRILIIDISFCNMLDLGTYFIYYPLIEKYLILLGSLLEYNVLNRGFYYQHTKTNTHSHEQTYPERVTNKTSSVWITITNLRLARFGHVQNNKYTHTCIPSDTICSDLSLFSPSYRKQNKNNAPTFLY